MPDAIHNLSPVATDETPTVCKPNVTTRTLDLSLTQLRHSKVTAIREQYGAPSNSPKKSPKRLKSTTGAILSPVKHKLSPLAYGSNVAPQSNGASTPLISPLTCFSPHGVEVKASTPIPAIGRAAQGELPNMHRREAGVNEGQVNPQQNQPVNGAHHDGQFVANEFQHYGTQHPKHCSKQPQQLQLNNQHNIQGSRRSPNCPQTPSTPRGNSSFPCSPQISTNPTISLNPQYETSNTKDKTTARDQLLSISQTDESQNSSTLPLSPIKAKTQKLFGRRSGSSEPDIFIFPDVSQSSSDNVSHTTNSDEVDGGYSDAPMDMDYQQGFGFSDYSTRLTDYSQQLSRHASLQHNFNSFGNENQFLSDMENIQSRGRKSFNSFHKTSGFDKPELHKSLGMFDRRTHHDHLGNNLHSTSSVGNSFGFGEPLPSTQHYSSNIDDFDGSATHHLQKSRVFRDTQPSLTRQRGPQRPLTVAGNRVKVADTYAEVLDTSEPEGVIHFFDRGSPDGQFEEHLPSERQHHLARYGFDNDQRCDWRQEFSKGYNQTPPAASGSGSHVSNVFGSSSSRNYGMSSPYGSDNTRGKQEHSFDGSGAGETRFTRADTNVLFISPDELSGSSMSCGEDGYSSNSSQDNFGGFTPGRDCIPGGEAPWDEMDGSLGDMRGLKLVKDTSNANTPNNYNGESISGNKLRYTWT